jgi:hypothetical protein
VLFWIRGANGVSLNWTSGTLQSAEVINGAFSDVGGAASPLVVTPNGVTKFYRLRQ